MKRFLVLAVVLLASLFFVGVVSAAGPYDRWLSPGAVVYSDPDVTADVSMTITETKAVSVDITTGWAKILTPSELAGFVETKYVLKDEPIELKIQRERTAWEEAQKVLNETKIGDLTWKQLKEMLLKVGVEIHEPVFAPSTYTVVKGDNLTKIANRFNVSLKDLIAANNLTNPNLIRPGDKLIIP